MEESIIFKWLSGSGSGSGSGYGSGYGSGDGDGSGSGSGSGDGYGSGSGSGSGDGDGYGSGYGDGDGYGDGYGYGSGYGYGYGDGDGYGSGYGSGDGDGSGSGSGSGDGYGDGYGYGYGSGYGDGYESSNGLEIKTYNSNRVFIIDGMSTVIKSIIGNYAKGYTINHIDFTTMPCYIAKDPSTGLFSHGGTLREAAQSLASKVIDHLPEDEKIKRFTDHFEKNKTYRGAEFFNWHNLLTGSCLFGRNQFVESHGLDLEKEYTVKQFIALTENEYGGETIKKLKEQYYE